MGNQTIVNPLAEEEQRARILKIALLGATIAVICILFFAAFTWFQPDQLSLSDQYFPSPTATFTRTPTLTPTFTSTPTVTFTPTMTFTPTVTPTPHVLIVPPEGVNMLVETFDSNVHQWDAYYGNNVARVQDGKLFLKSNKQGSIGIAICSDCINYGETFYFQAELLPEKESSIQHGLTFCASTGEGEFYAFLMNPSTSDYSLYKHKADQWQTLIQNLYTNSIHKYPASNTMSVYFDEGKMDIYINGIHVNSYTDSNPFSCKWAGVIVDDGKLELIVDNVFTYNMEAAITTTLTPTP